MQCERPDHRTTRQVPDAARVVGQRESTCRSAEVRDLLSGAHADGVAGRVCWR
jgi:hypothetical protein